jgi:hypothetical protein
MVSGGFQIASGVVGVAGPTLQNGQLSPGAEGTQSILQGAGSAARGAGEMFAAEDNRAAGVADADATEAGHAAEAAKRRIDHLEKEAAAARELAKLAIDFLRERTRTKASTDAAAASIRG